MKGRKGYIKFEVTFVKFGVNIRLIQPKFQKNLIDTVMDSFGKPNLYTLLPVGISPRAFHRFNMYDIDTNFDVNDDDRESV